MGTVRWDLEGRLWAALANVTLTYSGFCAWRENQDVICGFDARRSRFYVKSQGVARDFLRLAFLGPKLFAPHPLYLGHGADGNGALASNPMVARLLLSLFAFTKPYGVTWRGRSRERLQLRELTTQRGLTGL